MVHAINDAAYGDALTRALYARLLLNEEKEEDEDATVHIIIRPVSVDRGQRAARCVCRGTLSQRKRIKKE
jgi:hypothetical protein